MDFLYFSIYVFILGYGVYTTKEFVKGSPLLNYKGELLKKREGDSQAEYYKEHGLGCFIFYFSHGGEKLWYGFQ